MEQIKCYCGHTDYCDCGPLEPKVKTPMQKLFERLESRPVPISTDSAIWHMLKLNSLAIERTAMEEQYWEGYKEGQYSGDQTALESFNKKYTQDEDTTH